MTRKYKNYTDLDIVNKSKEVKSIAGLLRKLDLVSVGGNYYTIKRKLKQLSVDTSHWSGQGWNKGERLKDWTNYKRIVYLKKHLISSRRRKCERCGRKTWKKAQIPLDVHHIDEDRTNNKLDNLLLVCPNCHYQLHSKL